MLMLPRTLLTNIVVEVTGIVLRVDDDFNGGDDHLVLILQPRTMISYRHEQILSNAIFA